MNPFKLRYVRGQWDYSEISKTRWIRLHALHKNNEVVN